MSPFFIHSLRASNCLVLPKIIVHRKSCTLLICIVLCFLLTWPNSTQRSVKYSIFSFIILSVCRAFRQAVLKNSINTQSTNGVKFMPHAMYLFRRGMKKWTRFWKIWIPSVLEWPLLFFKLIVQLVTYIYSKKRNRNFNSEFKMCSVCVFMPMRYYIEWNKK